MKILQIISGNDSGGAKTHIFNLCSASNMLFENIVCCINKGVLYEQSSKLGLNVELFEQSSRMDLKIIKDIADYVKDNNIDIINFHGAKPNYLHIFLKHRINTPCVTTIHSDYRYDFINSKLKYIFFTPLNVLSLRGFRNFICVSRRVQQLLEHKRFKGMKYVVANGVDHRVGIKTDRDDVREQYNLPKEVFVYTMVARLHPIKNHANLLMAVALLVKKHKDIRLLLVGNGDYQEKLKEMVSELKIDNYVIFTGYQQNPMDFINAGDINMLTSLNETFPIVILEGALVKKTAICSDVGDVKDIIDDESGFLINPKSVDDIYCKMENAYIRRHELKLMGEKLNRTILDNYTLDYFHNRYYDSYKNILKGDIDG